MALYKIYNGARPTTAAIAKVATGTAIKTMLQVLNANRLMKIIEWGVSMDGDAAATPGVWELLQTRTVAATVTAHVASGVCQYNPAAESAAPANADFTLSTTGTGFTATAEGSITDTVVFDAQLISPTDQFLVQFPLGREPVVDIADVLRIRCTTPATVNALCYVLVEV